MFKNEREKKVSRTEARTTRKCLLKRDPVTGKIYELLIQAAGNPNSHFLEAVDRFFSK